jgi:hypothetical protein
MRVKNSAITAAAMRRSNCLMPDRRRWLLLPILLTACGPQPQVERIDLSDVGEASGTVLTPSPDSEGASWSLAPGGLAIQFGKDPQAPYLALTCNLSKDSPPAITIIRNAQADPGAKALFAIMGGTTAARLKVDARQSATGWRWEGTYPADASELDAFAATTGLEATLPGAGTLKAAGSPLTREFIDWCREGGKALVDAPKGSQTPS